MCGCAGGNRANQTTMTPEELVAAAQGRAEERERLVEEASLSQERALENASA